MWNKSCNILAGRCHSALQSALNEENSYDPASAFGRKPLVGRCVLRLNLVRAVIVIALLFLVQTTFAREAQSSTLENSPDPVAAPDADEEVIDVATGSLDDSTGSVAVRRKKEGPSTTGDMRIDYSYTDTDDRDSSNQTLSILKGRFRAGGHYNFSPSILMAGRIATTCSTEQCDPDFVLDGPLPMRKSINDGDITFDELYIHGFIADKFDVAVGRLQTKFVSRAGVFARSLDRSDSHGTNVNWTDGMHAVWHVNKAWATHLILQYNQADGAGNVRHRPLDFSDDGSRITYFLGLENFQRLGPINQQGFDITYMPASMMKDGSPDGRIEDYVGLVGRFAASWPEGSTGRRLNVAGEVGYAPDTPTRTAAGLAGTGHTDGRAFILSASLVDFLPNHSIGINYGRAEAGWLLSPQYSPNEQVVEIRYVWRQSRNLAVDVRGRWREELERLETADRKKEDLNWLVRFTVGFGH